MMKIIELKPVPVSPRILQLLDRKGLIRTFRPPAKVFGLKPGTGVVDVVYATHSRYGSHKLICVGKNETEIRLTTHPDNEEFFIINNTKKKFKPLYLIISLHRERELSRRAQDGRISSKDILALELKYNDCSLSLFTMLKGTPHCEVTIPGAQEAPVFFVTEPTNLTMKVVDLAGWKPRLRPQIKGAAGKRSLMTAGAPRSG